MINLLLLNFERRHSALSSISEKERDLVKLHLFKLSGKRDKPNATKRTKIFNRHYIYPSTKTHSVFNESLIADRSGYKKICSQFNTTWQYQSFTE